MTTNEPLASKIRPKNLKEFIGQDHLVGDNKPLRVAIDKQHLFSMLFWGPPGVGKTTLSKIYAKSLDANLIELSAVSANKDDIRQAVKKAENSETPTVLFLDEIHRFNKAQQDFLLPFVETGVLTLIGATTENPSFEVISPLLSRCRVFILNDLSELDMGKIITRCVKSLPTKTTINKKAKDWLSAMANGDARQAITMIENTFNLYQSLEVEDLKNTLQSKHLRFDKKGEEHYNTISAFIKSMRASQPDAAIYYLSRMIDAGEDPIFIARRMVVFASEDIGLAQPTALVVANAVFKSCQTIGYPECAINLAHGVAYLAQAKKSRAAYDALRSAQQDIKNYGNLPIPLEIRNAPTKLMKDIGYGQGYQAYTKKSYLPEKLANKKYLKNQPKS
jgi:putative ATPase